MARDQMSPSVTGKMSPSVTELIQQAKAGRSVYITDLHALFSDLADRESHRLAFVVEMLDGTGLRRFDQRVPRVDGLERDERAFVEDYIHAEVYNIISALGGRRMTVYSDQGSAELLAILSRLPAVFGIGLPRSSRSGYGRAVNVTDRMIGALTPGAPGFSFEFAPLDQAPAAMRPRSPAVDLVGFFRGRTRQLEGKALIGLDVGGTDIKAVLVDDGRIVDYAEYDWYPAGFLRSRQLVDPILLIVRLLVARLWIHRLGEADGRRAALVELSSKALHTGMGSASTAEMASSTPPEEMARALADLEAAGLDRRLRCDGIGLCFPDVVVRNKIVGGEVYKTRGIRNNPDIDYERDFAELTDLDVRLREWVTPGGVVRIINDGPMAAFTAAVEMAASPDATDVASGVFAHTLGTELGTGWVTETGAIPDIPLEVYNFIIDLGCWPERAFEPDDLRSLNNFNTGLPGTLQKYCSQSGVFRLAFKRFSAERPDLLRELEEKGFVERRRADGTEGWYVPTEPVDQRKPFLEHMMMLPDREGDETNREIWREIGKSLAVTLLETRRILEPGTDLRFLFGRLVKNAACFELMVEGARGVDPRIRLVAAGAGMAHTPLMKQLEMHPHATVAQFAQAIGAVYFVNE
jgi:predicted NBD/HSP70 family sugar kinase